MLLTFHNAQDSSHNKEESGPMSIVQRWINPALKLNLGGTLATHGRILNILMPRWYPGQLDQYLGMRPR
jgi:hypothetical protein